MFVVHCNSPRIRSLLTPSFRSQAMTLFLIPSLLRLTKRMHIWSANRRIITSIDKVSNRRKPLEFRLTAMAYQIAPVWRGLITDMSTTRVCLTVNSTGTSGDSPKWRIWIDEGNVLADLEQSVKPLYIVGTVTRTARRLRC